MRNREAKRKREHKKGSEIEGIWKIKREGIREEEKKREGIEEKRIYERRS
jgi:hypothetical protein